MKYIRLLIVVFVAYGIGTSNAQDADVLLRSMDELISAPIDKQATVEIILINKEGKEKVREASMKQKGKDRKLYRYTQPESQAGIATLSLPEDVMWLYMPAFGKPTKISLLAKSQAFTGTDFSYEDMESRSYTERYSASMLDSESDDYFLLELTPKSEKSKYSKIELYLNKEINYPQKMVYFDTRGNIYKIATYSYTNLGNYWYASEVVMTDLKKAHSTKIRMTEVAFDQGLSNDEFTMEKLKPE